MRQIYAAGAGQGAPRPPSGGAIRPPSAAVRARSRACRHRDPSSDDSSDPGAEPARESGPHAANRYVGRSPAMEGHAASVVIRIVLARGPARRFPTRCCVRASTGANRRGDFDPPSSPLPREQQLGRAPSAEPRVLKRHEAEPEPPTKASVQPPAAMPATLRAGSRPEAAAPGREVEGQPEEVRVAARAGRAAGRRSRSGPPNGGCRNGRTRRRVPGCRSGRPWRPRSLRRLCRPDAHSPLRDASASPSSRRESGSSASDHSPAQRLRRRRSPRPARAPRLPRERRCRYRGAGRPRRGRRRN